MTTTERVELKPVMQTILGYGGNCFAACIASILNLRIDEVPNFVWKDGKENDRYAHDCQEWLNERGYVMIDFKTGEGSAWPEFVPVILSGPTARSETIHHSVIGKLVHRGNEKYEFEFVHDPHPGAQFLTEVRWVTFILPISRPPVAVEVERRLAMAVVTSYYHEGAIGHHFCIHCLRDATKADMGFTCDHEADCIFQDAEKIIRPSLIKEESHE